MTGEVSGDEVNLLEILQILKGYKLLLLGLPLVGAIFAVIFAYFILHPSWEASATVEVGQVGQEGVPMQVAIEPLASIATRVTFDSFVRQVIGAAGFGASEAPIAEAYLATLKLVPLKKDNVFAVTVKGASPDMAKKLLDGFATSLINEHGKMLSDVLIRYEKRIKGLNEDIRAQEIDTGLVKNRLLSSDGHNVGLNVFDATLSASILQNSINDLRGLKQKKLKLEELMAPAVTYNSKIVDEVKVSAGPVRPNKPLIVGVAMLAGLLAAIMIALFHNAIKTQKSA